MPLRYQKKESLVHLSSIVADRVVVRGGHCYYRVLSLLCFTYRIVQYPYIYRSLGRLSIELYSSLHDHDRSIHDLLVIATG
jgi:hypothetical protein